MKLKENPVFLLQHRKKERASEKTGEHRKKKELWYNTKKMWSSPRKVGEIGKNTRKKMEKHQKNVESHLFKQ